MSLQRRVTLALVGIVALFVMVQGTLAYLSLGEQEDDLVDELVLSEARQLAVQADRGELRGARAVDLLDPGPNLSAWLVEPSGRVIPGPLPQALRGLGDGAHRLGGPTEPLHVVVMATTAGRLFMQYDARQNEAQVHQFGLYLLGLGALCIALSFAVARWVAGVVVAPIERVTARLASWAPDAPSPATAASDEEGRLLEAFGRVRTRLEQTIASEREFTANVSHEIRTPLAALRTDAEMLGLSRDLSGDQRERLGRMTRTVDQIAEAVESARALARRQLVVARPVDLARCVDDAWESLEPVAAASGLRFVNEVPAGSLVVADRHALLTILRNLFRNAAEHATPARCVVRRTATGLEIEDDGPGIGERNLPLVFERYWHGRLVDAPGEPAPGERGLGLAIARQLADLNGWRLTVDSVEGRGTRFRLDIEPA